jgi:hypothetical protein
MTLNSIAGDAAAESYFSIAEADAYFSSRGVTAWTGTDAVKEQAARKGTTYLDNAYRERWKGITSTQPQALAWPRVEGSRGGRPFYGSSYPLLDENGWQIDPTIVPVQVKRAAMEAALLAIGVTVLEPALVRGGQIKSIDKSVGPLRKAIVYADGAPAIDRYTAIDGLLRGLVTSAPGAASGNIGLVRA